MTHVYIAIPSYSGEIGAPTVISLQRALKEAAALGVETTVDIRAHDSLLPRARNLLVQHFLDSAATDLVFWDSDVAPDPGGFARLLSHDVDCVAGCYRTRSDPERYVFRPLPGDREDRATGLIEIEAIGAGFLRLRRQGVERTAAHFPDLWIEDRDAGRLTWLFDNLKIGNRYFSEDFVFCQRFREAGGQVWIDPNLALAHTGPKTFSGCYGDRLRVALGARVTAEEIAEGDARMRRLTASFL